MLKAKLATNINDHPMSIRQALRHTYANEFMAAFAEEISSLVDMKTFVAFLGDPKSIAKGSLLSSKAIFSIVYQMEALRNLKLD